ncbi:hypothetical protein ACHAW5_009417 [Stephanodiscus triporus]|uniref:Uncharacterized protein n=1 Tax=Stephanodiscus triporus TaxID=2934178 RepID=A0ABD3QPH3_9STRA
MATPTFGYSVSLGSCVAGIPVKLHYSFFLLLLLEFVSSVLNYKVGYDRYPMYILLVVVLYGPILLLTILVHEFGHALTTKRLGGTVDGIVLWPLGGFALCGPVDALVGDLKVALMGPMTHVPMGFLWWVLYAILRDGEFSGLWPNATIYLDVLSTPAGFFETLSAQALYINIALFCFNLLIPGERRARAGICISANPLGVFSFFFLSSPTPTDFVPSSASAQLPQNEIRTKKKKSAYPLDGGRVFAACLILKFKLKSLAAAKVTAITAMIISAGMILYAIISFFTSAYSFELFVGLVGCFVFYESYELWAAARRDGLADHSIFGRKCYQDSVVGDANEPPVPAQDDEAVMA